MASPHETQQQEPSHPQRAQGPFNPPTPRPATQHDVILQPPGNFTTRLRRSRRQLPPRAIAFEVRLVRRRRRPPGPELVEGARGRPGGPAHRAETRPGQRKPDGRGLRVEGEAVQRVAAQELLLAREAVDGVGPHGPECAGVGRGSCALARRPSATTCGKMPVSENCGMGTQIAGSRCRWEDRCLPAKTG